MKKFKKVINFSFIILVFGLFTTFISQGIFNSYLNESKYENSITNYSKAAVTSVKTASELVTALSSNSNIVLENNIDFNNFVLPTNPIDKYSGNINGNNYQISNLNIKNNEYLINTFEGNINNVIFSNTTSFAKVIDGSTFDQITIKNMNWTYQLITSVTSLNSSEVINSGMFSNLIQNATFTNLVVENNSFINSAVYNLYPTTLFTGVTTNFGFLAGSIINTTFQDTYFLNNTISGKNFSSISYDSNFQVRGGNFNLGLIAGTSEEVTMNNTFVYNSIFENINFITSFFNMGTLFGITSNSTLTNTVNYGLKISNIQETVTPPFANINPEETLFHVGGAFGSIENSTINNFVESYVYGTSTLKSKAIFDGNLGTNTLKNLYSEINLDQIQLNTEIEYKDITFFDATFWALPNWSDSNISTSKFTKFDRSSSTFDTGDDFGMPLWNNLVSFNLDIIQGTTSETTQEFIFNVKLTNLTSSISNLTLTIKSIFENDEDQVINLNEQTQFSLILPKNSEITVDYLKQNLNNWFWIEFFTTSSEEYTVIFNSLLTNTLPLVYQAPSLELIDSNAKQINAHLSSTEISINSLGTKSLILPNQKVDIYHYSDSKKATAELLASINLARLNIVDLKNDNYLNSNQWLWFDEKTLTYNVIDENRNLQEKQITFEANYNSLTNTSLAEESSNIIYIILIVFTLILFTIILLFFLRYIFNKKISD